MKKLLYSVAIIAAVASCSKNEIDMTPSLDSQKTINFSTLNDRVASRAANDAGSNYQVFAVSADASYPSADWFMNEEIKGDDNTIKDGDSYFWPTMDLAFLAIAPISEVTASTFIDATGKVEVAYTNAADGQTDLTAAQVKSQGADEGAVALQFKHQLAKIIVRVSLDENDNAMTGWSINNEAGVQTGDDQLLTTFTAKNSVADFVFTATGDLSTMALASTPTAQIMAAQKSTTAGSGSDINILPQTSTGCTIDFTGLIVKNADGKVMNTSTAETYTIKDGDVTDIEGANMFYAGRVYILDLKISITEDNADIFNGSISFTSTPDAWVNGETDPYAAWPTNDTTDADVAF